MHHRRAHACTWADAEIIWLRRLPDCTVTLLISLKAALRSPTTSEPLTVLNYINHMTSDYTETVKLDKL